MSNNNDKELNPTVTETNGTNPNPTGEQQPKDPPKEKWWKRAKRRVADFAEEHPLITAVFKWTGRTALTAGAAYGGAKLAQRDFRKNYIPNYIPQQRAPIEIPDTGETVEETEPETCEDTYEE